MDIKNCGGQMKKIYLLTTLMILLISFTTALDIVQFNDRPVNYAVISNTYTIYSTNNLTHTEINLIRESNGVNTYEWNTSNQAGMRDFGLFNFSVISQVEEILNQVEDYTMFIGENESYFQISGFDLFNTSFEYLELSYENYGATINLANFLKGINAEISFVEGEKYPLVNSFILNSSTAITVIEAILMEEDHDFTVDDLNSNPQYYFNYLMDYYNLSLEYPLTTNITISEGFSRIDLAEGYGSLPDNLESRIRNQIQNGILYINPLEINDKVFEMTGQNISNYLGMEVMNNLNLTIDFSNFSTEDGTYSLSFDYTDNYGNSGTKGFTTIVAIEDPFVEEEPEEESSGSSSRSSNTGGTYWSIPQVKDIEDNIIQPTLNISEPDDNIIDLSQPEEKKCGFFCKIKNAFVNFFRWLFGGGT